MAPELRVVKWAEGQLLCFARDHSAVGLLVGCAFDSSILITGALSLQQGRDELVEEVDSLLTVLPGGLEAVGVFWTGSEDLTPEAERLLDVISKEKAISPLLATVGAQTGSGERPQYFEAKSTKEGAPQSKREAISVQQVEGNPLWQTHVPLCCQLPISLQISSPSEAFPSEEEVQKASETVGKDLLSNTAAFLVSSAGDPPRSVLVQPWAETASVSGRGFATGGTNSSAKKGGAKGKKKTAGQSQTAQEERDLSELTCEELGEAAESSSLQKVPRPIQVTFLQRQSCDGEPLRAPYLKIEPAAEHTTLHSVSLSLDVLCVAPASMRLRDAVKELLLPALEKQLKSATLLALEHKRGVVAHLFQPPGLAFPVTALYPQSKDEGEPLLVDIRTRLHKQFGLPLDRPLLRAANALTFDTRNGSSSEASTSGRLCDVHQGIRPSGVAQGKLSLIHGSYEYYHYMQDRIDDKGWGCAYRSLQTIVSWFRLQNYTTVPVPSHKTIQQTLVDLQDKEPSFVGSSQWIGAIELGYILDALLGVTCKVLNVNSGADLPSKARELAHHFETQGSPVMIGGGVLAYTLLGIDYNELTGDCAFLILDPHYTGGENLKTIQNGQWIGWKRGGANGIFLQNAFYNLLLPQRPQIV